MGQEVIAGREAGTGVGIPGHRRGLMGRHGDGEGDGEGARGGMGRRCSETGTKWKERGDIHGT